MHLESLVAHRGASPYAPENTLVAFEKARELGSRAIEFDVMMSKDGEVFVFHDEQLKRTSNGVGKFTDATKEYIASLDAGSWFSPNFADSTIPTLTEVLAWCVTHDIQANIEIKPYSGAAERVAAAVLGCLNRTWPRDMQLPLVSSFDTEILSRCSSLIPELPVGLLMHRWHKTSWRDAAQELGAFSIHLPRYVVTKERIQAVKQAGYAVCIYTVNCKKLAKTFLEWGADSVLSDYPDLMCA